MRLLMLTATILMFSVMVVFFTLGLYSMSGFLWALVRNGMAVAPFDPAIWFIMAFSAAGIIRMIDLGAARID